MNLTTFQRLVLIGIAMILRALNHNHDDYAKMLGDIATGHHTETQQKALLEEWRMTVIRGRVAKLTRPKQ